MYWARNCSARLAKVRSSSFNDISSVSSPGCHPGAGFGLRTSPPVSLVNVSRARSAARSRRFCEGVRLRSEEHTSELQSLTNLVCRLLLETTTLIDTSTHTL